MPPSTTPFCTLALAVAVLCLGGCLVQRTVKEGNEVVAQGYVIKPPVVTPAAPLP